MDFVRLIEDNQVEVYLSSLDSKDPLILAEGHYNLGRVYCRTFADIERSDYHYIIAENLFNKEGQMKNRIACKRDLAVNRELIGEYENAYVGFRECVDMSLEINYVYGFTIAMGGITLIHHHLNDMENPRVTQAIEDCKKFNERHPDAQLSESLVLLQSLYGNISSRLRDRIHAQESLEELIQTTKHAHTKWSGTRFLIINYIDEMLLTRSTDLLDRAKELFESLAPAAQNNFILKIRLDILEARLEMISGNLTKTKEKLEGVLEILDGISKSQVITRFVDEVEFELGQLKDQYGKWRDYLRMNVMLESEARSDELMQYIEMAQQSLQYS
ncbi:MAG: hypothetical protein GPJ54_07325 [Candidatus Heimdallarchaeota archaeon]|nr:hypothetical protein [Candidatus Heimdallarchaeota archaeon]